MTQRINENNAVQDDEEIDLLQLWQTLVKNKRLILLSSFGAAMLAAGISLLMPNIYRAEVLLAPVSTEGATSGGLASALGGLGGLASMAGISVGGGGSTEENLAVLTSRDFLWAFVHEKKLMPILFEDDWDAQKNTWVETDPKKQPGQMDVYRLFNEGGLMSVDQDKKTELVTLSINSKDAKFAAELANMLVESVNHYLSQQTIARSEGNLKYLNEELMRTPVEEMRKTLFDLIANEQKSAMLANTQKAFAFKVLDSAVEPDKKIKPKRAIFTVVAGFIVGILTVFFVLIKDSIRRRKEEKV